VLASLAAGLFGGSTAVAGTVYAYSVDISTAVFVLAVALLFLRPGLGPRASEQTAQRIE
jgi:1,4-dihydroxy-2-naphthoate octaprenyltransferase